jgi:CheY-like chemotaxis protein
MTKERSLGRVVLVSHDSDWRHILGTMLRHVGIEVVEVGEPDRIHQDANGAALIVTNYPVHMSDGRTVTEYIRTSPAIAGSCATRSAGAPPLC